ncbi:MAG TPA: hypothetical protein VMY80_13565 [Anaerolineae bacterium]|jgi:hypothetical protein|nr:hypothetical protein [Anaerolineae bacterium]
MGWFVLVVGLLFLLAGLALSLWEAFGDIAVRVRGLIGRRASDTTDALTKLVEAIASLLEAFAKLTIGVQLSLIGLVLTYWGLRILGMLA